MALQRRAPMYNSHPSLTFKFSSPPRGGTGRPAIRGARQASQLCTTRFHLFCAFDRVA